MNCAGEGAALKEGHHDTSEDMLGGETDMSVDVVRSPLHGWPMKHIYTRWQQKPGGTRIAT